MSLVKKLSHWDGKSAADIGAVYTAHGKQAGFARQLLELMADADTQKAASWLLKAWLEDKNRLDADQLNSLYKALPSLQCWESKLHILQCLPYMEIPRKHRKAVERFLRTTLPDPNKFVRAWSYNGFYELARQFPEYQAETEKLFEMAMRDEAASVQARVRNLKKQGFS